MGSPAVFFNPNQYKSQKKVGYISYDPSIYRTKRNETEQHNKYNNAADSWSCRNFKIGCGWGDKKITVTKEDCAAMSSQAEMDECYAQLAKKEKSSSTWGNIFEEIGSLIGGASRARYGEPEPEPVDNSKKYITIALVLVGGLVVIYAVSKFTNKKATVKS